MNQWQYFLLAGIAAALILLKLCSALTKRKKRLQRDFTRRLETVLKPKEAVKAICPEKGGRWILTNQRLLIEQGEAFFAIPFKKVKKISGVDKAGKATVAAANMAEVTVKADQDHVLHRRGEDFTVLVKGLKTAVSRAKPKKKTGGPKSCKKSTKS